MHDKVRDSLDGSANGAAKHPRWNSRSRDARLGRHGRSPWGGTRPEWPERRTVEAGPSHVADTATAAVDRRLPRCSVLPAEPKRGYSNPMGRKTNEGRHVGFMAARGSTLRPASIAMGRRLRATCVESRQASAVLQELGPAAARQTATALRHLLRAAGLQRRAGGRCPGGSGRGSRERRAAGGRKGMAVRRFVLRYGIALVAKRIEHLPHSDPPCAVIEPVALEVRRLRASRRRDPRRRTERFGSRDGCRVVGCCGRKPSRGAGTLTTCDERPLAGQCHRSLPVACWFAGMPTDPDTAARTPGGYFDSGFRARGAPATMPVRLRMRRATPRGARLSQNRNLA